MQEDPAAASTPPETCESDGKTMCLNIRRVVSHSVELAGKESESALNPLVSQRRIAAAEAEERKQPRRAASAVASKVGLFLLEELAGYAVEQTLDQITGLVVSSLFGGSGGEGEDKCEEFLRIDFCNDIIFHSVSGEVHKKKNERDLNAKKAYEKITQSEVRGGGHNTTMKALTEENNVCKRVVKQSLCLAAFPPCNCLADMTACKNNCDLIN